MKARRHKLQPSKWGVDPNLALLNKLSLSATSYLLLLPFLDSSLTSTVKHSLQTIRCELL